MADAKDVIKSQKFAMQEPCVLKLVLQILIVILWRAINVLVADVPGQVFYNKIVTSSLLNIIFPF